MSSTFTRTLTSAAACVLTFLFTLATPPVASGAGAGVTIISFI